MRFTERARCKTRLARLAQGPISLIAQVTYGERCGSGLTRNAGAIAEPEVPVRALHVGFDAIIELGVR